MLLATEKHEQGDDDMEEALHDLIVSCKNTKKDAKYAQFYTHYSLKNKQLLSNNLSDNKWQQTITVDYKRLING